jgi:hypothetical protein
MLVPPLLLLAEEGQPVKRGTHEIATKIPQTLDTMLSAPDAGRPKPVKKLDEHHEGTQRTKNSFTLVLCVPSWLYISISQRNLPIPHPREHLTLCPIDPQRRQRDEPVLQRF